MEKEITYIRLPLDVKRVVAQAAKADQRSLSAFLAKLVADWAKAQQPMKTRRSTS